jgi:TRAP-type C4-dicarboxylate transport system permease small subunit
MERFADAFCRLLTTLIAVMLAVLVIMVFSNVVLRYAFNSSITVTEELGRWLFVWITFIGAAVALRERSHLGTDALVSRLSPRGKKICIALGHLIMLYVCWLVLRGSVEQARINWDVLAPSSQLSMATLYMAGVVFAVLAGLMLLLDLWSLLRGRMSDEQLVMVQESEDLTALNQREREGRAS